MSCDATSGTVIRERNASIGYTYSDKKELGYSDKNIAVILL